ncbi:MAG TPA: alginate lyase family protein [Candidatus Elarobacter sp.]|nr:alginate lyase family protein [Dongiaceae bacterium]HZW54190.1 alginate lyase family protein [Candidatus Elarobacter sp.]
METRTAAGTVLVMFALVAVSWSGPAQSLPAASPVPKTVVLDGGALSSIASRFTGGTATAAQRAALEQLRTLADKDAKYGLKNAHVRGGPGTSPHQYYSEAPYWWPCNHPPDKQPVKKPCTQAPISPACPLGYAYVRYDGYRNPELKSHPDHLHQVDTWRAVSELSLAWFYASRLPAGSDGGHATATAYAKHAKRLLHAWFIDPATAQTADFAKAQTIPCNSGVRGEGILEATASLTQLLDALALLDSGAPRNGWNDGAAMRAWLTRFRHWMLKSQQGIDESHQTNNHGSWKALGDAALALYLGDAPGAGRIVTERSGKLIPAQIEPDGEQPLELKRTKPWHYSNYNATALCRLAELAAHIPRGLDVWHYAGGTPPSGSLVKAIDYLIPAAENGDDAWHHKTTIEPTIDDIRYLAYYELRAAASQADGAAATAAVDHTPPVLQTPPPAQFQTPAPVGSPPPPFERGNLWDVVPDCEILTGSGG